MNTYYLLMKLLLHDGIRNITFLTRKAFECGMPPLSICYQIYLFFFFDHYNMHDCWEKY